MRNNIKQAIGFLLLCLVLFGCSDYTSEVQVNKNKPEYNPRIKYAYDNQISNVSIIVVDSVEYIVIYRTGIIKHSK